MENLNVAYCGLYCGECGSYKKGKCAGCQKNDRATWCEVRKCCREHGFATCADCKDIPLKQCKKYNNVFAKVIGFVTRTDRSKCIERIRIIGSEAFAQEMTLLKISSMKK